MSVSEIQLFQILKSKLGEKEAEELVTFVKAEVKAEFDSKREILATKEDLANVREDLAHVKADVIKWMFIFWIGQIGVLVGLLYPFITK